MALISSSLVLSCSSSSMKWRISTQMRSAETAGNVIFCLLFRRVLKDNGGVVEFDQTTQQEEAGMVGDARGLLHVVGDDDDGATALELEDEVFDFRGGDGIEGGTGLVQQEHFRIYGKGAGDAQALLLAAGEAISGLIEFIFHFVPESGAAQALLYFFV